MKQFVISIFIISSSLVAVAQKSEQPPQHDMGERLKVGYETYVDFHYTYNFNRPINNKRYTNSNPEYVNQFGMA
jgi:hypothetical protein